MEPDPEAQQLAAFKIFDQIQKDHSRLWDKLWEFKTTGVVPPPVYTADEFTEGHRVMFAKINNREYDSYLWALGPDPRCHDPRLTVRQREEYVQNLEKHKAWLRTLGCSEPYYLNQYEDIWYPSLFEEAKWDLEAENPNRNQEREDFLRREEHLALCQLQLMKNMHKHKDFQPLRRSKKIMVFQEARHLEPQDMTFVREENERQEGRERREHEARQRRKWQQGQYIEHYTPQRPPSMPVPKPKPVLLETVVVQSPAATPVAPGPTGASTSRDNSLEEPGEFSNEVPASSRLTSYDIGDGSPILASPEMSAYHQAAVATCRGLPPHQTGQAE